MKAACHDCRSAQVHSAAAHAGVPEHTESQNVNGSSVYKKITFLSFLVLFNVFVISCPGLIKTNNHLIIIQYSNDGTFIVAARLRETVS